MSAPEAKASRPAPRYTTARTESSLASDSVTSAISPHMARLTALRILGRLNTTVAMPPSRSTRISSLTVGLPFEVPSRGTQSSERTRKLQRAGRSGDACLRRESIDHGHRFDLDEGA